MLMMGLRTAEGVDLARLEAVTGLSLDQAADGAGLALMLEEGLLVLSEGCLRATPAGRPVLNGIIRQLLP
jgi:oxygen-independent coproporphyrinogen-3 oxidase